MSIMFTHLPGSFASDRYHLYSKTITECKKLLTRGEGPFSVDSENRWSMIMF